MNPDYYQKIGLFALVLSVTFTFGFPHTALSASMDSTRGGFHGGYLFIPASRTVFHIHVPIQVLATIGYHASVAPVYASLSEQARSATAERTVFQSHIVYGPLFPFRRLMQSGTPRRLERDGIGTIVATAYSSTPDQTDDDPCTTANGYNVCSHGQENVVAANFLPFGTRVRFPDAFGERIFIVQDRMHPRFANRVDIWMKTRNAAKQFGVQHLRMEVVKDQLAMK